MKGLTNQIIYPVDHKFEVNQLGNRLKIHIPPKDPKAKLNNEVDFIILMALGLSQLIYHENLSKELKLSGAICMKLQFERWIKVGAAARNYEVRYLAQQYLRDLRKVLEEAKQENDRLREEVDRLKRQLSAKEPESQVN
jgi:hypothetical protein